MMKSPITSFQSVSQETIMKSIELTVAEAGIAPQEFMPVVRGELKKTSDPRRALNNFHRFLGSAFNVSLLREFSSQRILLEIALNLFGQSQYLSDILVRTPSLFSWLVTSGALKTTKTLEAFHAEARKSVEPFDRLEKKLGALKRFQRREMLRIGARDVLREAHIMTITIELSSLADAVIETVLSLGQEELKRSMGLSPENPIAVIGLGKLGGNELNFSSDIDLMFVYGKDEEFPNPAHRAKTMFEYCSRLSEFVVRRLSEHTDEGHLYRVDLRLRPDANAGSITMPVSAYRSYYESRGELWERQMLLKARTVAGNKSVGEALLKELEPFVYPKTHLVSPLKEISEMKRRIEAKVAGDVNIKLGSGGIRDIEFVVQALQLLNGGNLPSVRARATMKALSQLKAEKILTLEEESTLTESYEFLRTVEHRLQLMHGQQTHSLPESLDETETLSKGLGFTSAGDFRKTLDSRRRNVREIFDSVFQRGEERSVGDETRTPGAHIFEGVRFIDRASRKTMRDLFEEIPPFQEARVLRTLYNALVKFGAADWSARNLASLCSESHVQRSIPQVFQNPKLLELLIMLSARSSRMIQTLMREPLLFESLLVRPDEMLKEELAWEFMLESDPMRYRIFNEFKVCLRFLLGLTSVEQTTKHLSLLADRAIVRGLERNLDLAGVCILALGRLGGGEMSVGSDIDLMCVYDRAKATPELEHSLKEFIAYFAKPETCIYDIDFRLRPEGRNAPLATEIEYYDSYLMTRASLWEKQSLLKARVLAGDPEVGSRLNALIERHLWGRLPAGWAKEIIRMRKKMERERMKDPKRQELKLGRGGSTDIEFLVQALQLNAGRKAASIRSPNTFELLRLIRKRTILTRSKTIAMQSNYIYLRTLEMMIRLNSAGTSFELPRERILLKAISATMEERSIMDLKIRLGKIRKENRNLFQKTLKSLA
ncbi:MAG: hypothetical protein HY562_01125 [Ignavibacteriales bacterium]|nr:hypothetical protein [Ignavibacteriales bacterium]